MDDGGENFSVIASEAKQSRSHKEGLDCFVARAPRNDGGGRLDDA
jgi:hypothetical protein